MSAESAILSRTFPVGERSCTFSVPRPQPGKALCACVEWSPSPPARLSGSEWQQYREGRHSALSAIAEELGITIAVLEV